MYYTTIQRFEVSKGFCKQMNTLIQLECIKLLESDRKDTYTVTIKIQFQINSVHFELYLPKNPEINEAPQLLSIAIIIRNVS